MAGQRCVMLLRAINVGRRQMPMAALRDMAASFGWEDAKTHLASGNLVVTVKGSPAAAAKKLGSEIATHFGFHSNVIVRRHGWTSRRRSWFLFPSSKRDSPAGASPGRVAVLRTTRKR